MNRKKGLINFIKIPKIFDDCFLYFAQENDHIPFKIRRVYYITSAHPKLPRGCHAHKRGKQVLFCIQGTIKLYLDDGKAKREIFLDQPNIGVFIDKMIWHQMHEFKKNTILLILSSTKFIEKDYIRNYEKFKKKASQVS